MSLKEPSTETVSDKESGEPRNSGESTESFVSATTCTELQELELLRKSIDSQIAIRKAASQVSVPRPANQRFVPLVDKVQQRMTVEFAKQQTAPTVESVPTPSAIVSGAAGARSEPVRAALSAAAGAPPPTPGTKPTSESQSTSSGPNSGVFSDEWFAAKMMNALRVMDGKDSLHHHLDEKLLEAIAQGQYLQVIWEKIMKEVVAQRVCGPFENPPFKNYFCSLLGLVPKVGQPGAFRMIFNLSAGQPESVNSSTLDCFKTTKYNDFDKAVALVAELGSAAKVGKADLAAALRQTPIHPQDWPLLVFKAKHPATEKSWYFFEKCLPFGSGESCQIYQRILNALAFAVSKLTRKPFVNYTDDFFFADKGTASCNCQIELFIDVAADIGFPVSPNKTEWASEWVIFLGLLIHGKWQLIGLPQEKLDKADKLIQKFLLKKGARVKQFLSLAGYLNFLTRALNYSRPYLRRIYDTIQPVHTHLQWHVKIPVEVKQDLLMWKGFLNTNPFYKQFIDHLEQSVKEVGWFTDASGHPQLGLGCFLNGQWF